MICCTSKKQAPRLPTKVPRNSRQRDYKEEYRSLRKRIPWESHLRHARERCNNINNKAFYRYGGRGIRCYLTVEDIKKLWLRDGAFLLIKPSIGCKEKI